MKYILILLLLSSSVLDVTSQKLDSIPYQYGNLYYQVYGNTGETILLLSGGPGNDAEQLVPVAEKLGENNKVILLEQRGTGRSIPSKFDETTVNLKLAIGDINQIVDALELNNIILIGHSYGSTLVTLYASQYPEKIKTSILVSPGAGTPDMFWIAVCNIQSRLGRQESARWNELYYPNMDGSLDAAGKKEFNYLTRLAYIYDKRHIDHFMPMIEGFENKDAFRYLSKDVEQYGDTINQDLKKIKSPIHIIGGRQDIFSHMPYELKSINPTIDIHWIDECGHFPMFEQSKEFYAIIEDILNHN